MRIKLSIPIPASLLKQLDQEIDLGALPPFFYAVTTDSRLVEKGDLFVALRGKNKDGNDFLGKAYERGAALSVGERPHIGSLTVKDSALWLARLASLHLSLSRPYTVAITGSVGKTTTKEYVFRALTTRYRVHKTEENENNLLGLSKTLLSRPKDCDILVAELGSNHKGEIALLSSLLNPDAVIITAVGRAHLGMFGSEEEIFSEKTSILKGLKRGGLALLNRDDQKLRALSPEDASAFFVSQKGKADLFTEDVRFYEGAASFTLHGGGRILSASLPLASPVGLSALLFALALAFHLGIGWETALSAFSNPVSVKGRQELLYKNEYAIIDDTYNASPESMKEALLFLKRIGARRRRIAVLGDMAELGEEAAAIHEEIGREAARSAHLFFAFGNMARAYERGALEEGLSPEKIYTFKTAKDCADRIVRVACRNDVILIKASHVMGGSAIVKELIKDTPTA